MWYISKWYFNLLYILTYPFIIAKNLHSSFKLRATCTNLVLIGQCVSTYFTIDLIFSWSVWRKETNGSLNITINLTPQHIIHVHKDNKTPCQKQLHNLGPFLWDLQFVCVQIELVLLVFSIITNLNNNNNNNDIYLSSVFFSYQLL